MIVPIRFGCSNTSFPCKHKVKGKVGCSKPRCETYTHRLHNASHTQKIAANFNLSIFFNVLICCQNIVFAEKAQRKRPFARVFPIQVNKKQLKVIYQVQQQLKIFGRLLFFFFSYKKKESNLPKIKKKKKVICQRFSIKAVPGRFTVSHPYQMS